MCDYSLMTFPNRLAAEGEELAAHRFHCGSVGLVSAKDLAEWSNAKPESIWLKLKSFLGSTAEPKPAVCIPPGSRLRLKGIPQRVRSEYGVDKEENVVFTQLSAEAGTYRDAILFRNGATMLLQCLEEDQRLNVLSLGTEEPENLAAAAMTTQCLGS